jgi:ADP-dependent NAD(P)H-hydrate dehydratase / NAD(P)H-hydrate epimerase
VPAEGSATSALSLDDALTARLLPARDERSHKGSHGTLICVCGSTEYVGAALLAAAAATRAGAGLVALAVPSALHGLFAGRVPETITVSLPEHTGDVDDSGAAQVLAERAASALVIGCGLRESEGYRRLVLGLLGMPGPPAVVDGGALNLLARSGEWWRDVRRACVLTPHPGEFSRLTGEAVGAADDERAERAKEAAGRLGQVVVLKGARTVIAAADGRLAVAPFANPALASAGTGDVLAGAIGALLAQGLAPFEAACVGVYLHGMAGERVRKRLGDAGLVASDLPLELALARRELGRHKQF